MRLDCAGVEHAPAFEAADEFRDQGGGRGRSPQMVRGGGVQPAGSFRPHGAGGIERLEVGGRGASVAAEGECVVAVRKEFFPG